MYSEKKSSVGVAAWAGELDLVDKEAQQKREIYKSKVISR
jgi:hypothetical protein